MTFPGIQIPFKMRLSHMYRFYKTVGIMILQRQFFFGEIELEVDVLDRSRNDIYFIAFCHVLNHLKSS